MGFLRLGKDTSTRLWHTQQEKTDGAVWLVSHGRWLLLFKCVRGNEDSSRAVQSQAQD